MDSECTRLILYVSAVVVVELQNSMRYQLAVKVYVYV